VLFRSPNPEIANLEAVNFFPRQVEAALQAVVAIPTAPELVTQPSTTTTTPALVSSDHPNPWAENPKGKGFDRRVLIENQHVLAQPPAINLRNRSVSKATK
jgi:hypothetical protein